MTAPSYRYLATNDEASDCACCGRKGLKRVVWLAELGPDGEAIDDGEAYGTTCAAHLLLRRLPTQRKPSLSEAKAALEVAEREAHRLPFVQATAMATPEVTFGANKWNVRIAICGDAEVTITNAFEAKNQVYEDRNAVPRVVAKWHENRAREIMEGWGGVFNRSHYLHWKQLRELLSSQNPAKLRELGL